MSHSRSVPSTIPVSIASTQTRPTADRPTDGGSLPDSKQKSPDALPVRKASGTGLFGGRWFITTRSYNHNRLPTVP
ncbi:hypothetical protein RhiJN_13069 [Ceratobasidium sp. AG-Ba]|nr:hypothetical protein RhiJN_13069 [Ceratobasidium sp. AG-Ba]